MSEGKVICDKASDCYFHLADKERGFGCGGAIPHEPDTECGNCPVDYEAKCIPVEEK